MNNRKSPMVSVVMAMHNGDRYLAEAMESILSQSFADFEYIVIDDGSCDTSLSLARRFASQDARILIFSHENRGLTRCLNEGIAIARGKYVARMDADDISLPDRFLRQVTFLERNPNIAIVGGAVRLINQGGDVNGEIKFPLTDLEIRSRVEYGGCFAHPSVMIRTEVLRAIGGYRPAFLQAQDIDLWFRLSEKADMANLPDAVLNYRRHVEQTSFPRRKHQILAAVVARRSALVRRAGLVDPISDTTIIDEAFAKSIGVSDRDIADTMVTTLIWYARSATEIGCYVLSQDLLVEAWRALSNASKKCQWGLQIVREIIRNSVCSTSFGRLIWTLGKNVIK